MAQNLFSSQPSFEIYLALHSGHKVMSCRKLQDKYTGSLLDYLPNDVILPIRKIALPLDEKSERIAIYCKAKY